MQNGYDYKNQAWFDENGRYIRCGHPPEIDCCCYGKIHEGEIVDFHSKPKPETREGIYNEICRELMEYEQDTRTVGSQWVIAFHKLLVKIRNNYEGVITAQY